MAYWGRVAKRAWREAMQGAGLATAERMIIVLCTQAIVAALIYIGLGETALREAAFMRIATAAAPFAILPLLFIYSFPTIPPKIEREWEEWKAKNEVENQRERWGLLFQITNQYVDETGVRSAAMKNGLEWPPVDYLNTKLEEFGESWRVLRTHGPKFETYEVEKT